MLQATDEFEQISIFDIIPDPNNPRKYIDAFDDLELGRSVKEFGIIQPIMVRFAKKLGKYMVVYGHRRFQAAKDNQYDEINCIVKELTDAEALEYQIIENLQRKGINPMEESNAFQRLIKKGLSTAEMIADKLGVSTKYVYDRLSLQKVIPEVQEAVMNGTISISHGKQFARLPITDQNKLLKSISLSHNIDIIQIRSAIKSIFKLNLEEAIFDINNAKLLEKAGSCMKCKKRSGCNVLLFEDVQMDDVCFDATCYDSKVQAHIDEQIEKHQAEGKTVKLLSGKYSGEKDGLINARNWNETEELSSTVGIFLEVIGYSYSKVGQVINIKDDVENDDDVNQDSSHQAKSESAKHINYKEIFAEKCQGAIVEAFNNSLIEFPQEDPNKIISLYCTDRFCNLLHSLERKITTILGIDMDSDGEYSAFKTYVSTLSLGKKLALIHLINSIKAAERFSNYNGVKEEAIANLQKELRLTSIDFFKIAADLNAPYPLFTPTEVAETAEA